MLRLVGVLFLAASCYGTHMVFPTNTQNPCILMDITVHNQLSWTNSTNQTKFVSDWNFTDSTTISGNCNGNTPQLTRQWAIDGATYTFAFTNTSGQVSLTMSFAFVPDKVFKNGEKDAVTHEFKPLELSSDEKAFQCSNFPLATGTEKKGDNSYFVSVQIETLHVQAFNVKDGKFSEDEECDADKTTEPPTTQPPTTHTTEPVTNHTTEPVTNHTTEPVTNHTTATTPMTTPEPTPNNQHPKTTVTVVDMGVTCIVMQGEFLFTLPYPKTDNTNGTATVGLQDVNMNQTKGSCNSSSNINSIQIHFLDTWKLDITFMKNGAKGMLGDDDTKYWWNDMEITYTLDDKTFPDHNKNVTTMNYKKSFSNDQFQATVSGSYMCNADSHLDLGNGYKMETWDLQYKAFQSGNTTSFSDDNVQECSADAKTNSIVPIAVGAALAGLVVIVLIAYLIGRRRNRKGYESV